MNRTRQFPLAAMITYGALLFVGVSLYTNILAEAFQNCFTVTYWFLPGGGFGRDMEFSVAGLCKCIPFVLCAGLTVAGCVFAVLAFWKQNRRFAILSVSMIGALVLGMIVHNYLAVYVFYDLNQIDPLMNADFTFVKAFLSGFPKGIRMSILQGRNGIFLGNTCMDIKVWFFLLSLVPGTLMLLCKPKQTLSVPAQDDGNSTV